MAEDSFVINGILIPQVLVVEKDFLIVYKPPRIHSAPLASTGANILSFCAEHFPEIMDMPGRKAGEGGLLHRLDYETQGLMLIARTLPGMEALLAQQKEGRIIKEYSALTSDSKAILPGFPLIKPELPLILSAFRPYGPGRKAVRPLGPCTDKIQYITEIFEKRQLSPKINSFIIKIFRGFRHQIRCHLAWLGEPIINDSLYGGAPHGKGFLGLRACSLLFNDPSSGRERFYSIPPVKPDEI